LLSPSEYAAEGILLDLQSIKPPSMVLVLKDVIPLAREKRREDDPVMAQAVWACMVLRCKLLSDACNDEGDGIPVAVLRQEALKATY
jgi:hypothetical protein